MKKVKLLISETTKPTAETFIFYCQVLVPRPVSSNKYLELELPRPGNLRAILVLKYLIQHNKSAAIVLYETLEICVKVGFNFSFVVDRLGLSGGLAVFGNNSVHCDILNYSHNHINLSIHDPSRRVWRLTSFYNYNHPEHSRRRDSWNFLRSLAPKCNYCWWL